MVPFYVRRGPLTVVTSGQLGLREQSIGEGFECWEDGWSGEKGCASHNGGEHGGKQGAGGRLEREQGTSGGFPSRFPVSNDSELNILSSLSFIIVFRPLFVECRDTLIRFVWSLPIPHSPFPIPQFPIPMYDPYPIPIRNSSM